MFTPYLSSPNTLLLLKLVAQEYIGKQDAGLVPKSPRQTPNEPQTALNISDPHL